MAALERLVIHEEHRERDRPSCSSRCIARRTGGRSWSSSSTRSSSTSCDPIDQVQTLHEIAEIHEDPRRGDRSRARRRSRARGGSTSRDDAALTKLLALAGKLGAWDEAVAHRRGRRGVGARTGSSPPALWARAAEIHETPASRSAVARFDAWRKVDAARPDDLLALAALDRLLALEGRVEELVVVVERRAELAEDAGVRLVLLHRVAALYEEVLTDRPQAIGAYKNVLEVDDTDLAALDALERLYRAAIHA